MKTSQFIKNNSSPGDLVQDSDNDLHFRVAALTERQMFAAESLFASPKGALLARLDELEYFKVLTGS